MRQLSRAGPPCLPHAGPTLPVGRLHSGDGLHAMPHDHRLPVGRLNRQSLPDRHNHRLPCYCVSFGRFLEWTVARQTSESNRYPASTAWSCFVKIRPSSIPLASSPSSQQGRQSCAPARCLPQTHMGRLNAREDPPAPMKPAFTR